MMSFGMRDFGLQQEVASESMPKPDARSWRPFMCFVHLHLHTQYSLLDGANKISALIPHVKRLGMPAVAMTDHGNMFGAVEFYKKAVEAGVKPILGCEVYVAPKSRTDRIGRSDDFEAGGNYHLTLLAMNEQGYSNLCRLVTKGYHRRLLLQAEDRQGASPRIERRHHRPLGVPVERGRTARSPSTTSSARGR